MKHLPGQYVDLHIPSISTVGGFTITSPPQTCLKPRSEDSPDPYIELAIQRSPHNPPAAFLWKESSEILNSELSFKVGGNFAFPPLPLSKEECEKLDNVVFVAGGVGVNPIMSMISAMDWKGIFTNNGMGKPVWGSPVGVGGMRRRVRVLYASKREEGGHILFERRLESIARRWEAVDGVDLQLAFWETGEAPRDESDDGVVKRRKGRITHDDLMEALGPEDQRVNTVVYVCGVPDMTDDFVEVLRHAKGMDERRVLCEKWW